MAKELPYFKFEPNQWDSGNVQMCSMEAQGLFINLCSLYWSRLGELPEKLAMQKLCKSYASAYDELMQEGIISVSDGNIIIDYLDEQLNEFADTSQKRRDAANKRWANAKAMQVHSKSNAIREDKIREEEKRKEEIITENKFSEEVNEFYELILPEFPKESRPKNEKAVEKWKNDIRLLNEKEEIDFNSLEHVIKWARNHEFWSGNFMSLLKLRQKDKNGVLFIHRFINQGRQEFRNSKQGKLAKLFDDMGVKPEDLIDDGVKY